MQQADDPMRARRHHGGALAICALALAIATSSCGVVTRMPLDPSFEPRAQEVPTTLGSVFWPNAPMAMGDVTLTNVELERHEAAHVDVGKVRAELGTSSWQLVFEVRRPSSSTLASVCEGTRGGGGTQIVCTFGAGPSAWTMTLSSSEGYRGVIRHRDEELTVAPAERVQGRLYASNVSGYYVRRGPDRIEGAIDTTYRGQPRVWVASDVAPESRPMILAALGAIHILLGRPG